MSTLTAAIQLNDVMRINRRGIGDIYRGQISLQTLHDAIKHSTIRYAPRYQRGFKKHMEKGEADYDLLLPIDHPELQIDPKRSQAMAVKYLQGRLFTSHVTWNARVEEGDEAPEFDEETRTLSIPTSLSVPDTGHRHLAYFDLVEWSERPSEIPQQVTVNDDPVSGDEIRKMLKGFDPKSEQVFCEVYMLTPEKEGRLYDEFNADAKPPARAVAIDLNQQKTPTRRFIYALMDRCSIFSRDEVETRANTIGSKSKKLTTNSTLEGAVQPIRSELIQLEKDEREKGDGSYKDLLDFTCSFFEEWGRHFPAFQPGASADERHQLRDRSFALSNVMMHPLFQLVYDLWSDYHNRKAEWKSDDAWKKAIAKLAGDVTATDEKGKTKTVNAMSRENPEWIGRVLIKRFDQDGKPLSPSVSSTRQTREAAYSYLCKVAGLKNGSPTGAKTAAAA
jgi:hypothetical protein